MLFVTKRNFTLTSCATIALSLSACAGGGGGSKELPAPPTTPPPPVIEVPEDQLPNDPISDEIVGDPFEGPRLPSQTSPEYIRNWGLGNSQAFAAWEVGATGKGVTVAVIDTGVDMDHPDLVPNLSLASHDVVEGRNAPQGINLHGNHVARILAAAHNDSGIIGTAYEATLLSIRADSPNCTAKTCFDNADLAKAIDYAVDNGSGIINLSLGNPQTLGSEFEQALLRAVKAGTIFAIASGNDAADNPVWPSRYVTDPRFAGSIIVVGAHDNNGELASFANKAGITRNSYLTAPGAAVVLDCDTGCWGISGTSYATPVVAGAMALLKEAFPNLSGKDVVDILLLSASDSGEAGTDTVWGRGQLNIARAFQPIGTTTTPLAGTQASMVLSTPEDTYIGAPFGDALGSTSTLSTILFDEYNRLFQFNMGSQFRNAPRPSYMPALQKQMVRTSVNAFGPAGTRLSLSAALPSQEPEPLLARNDLYNAPWMGIEERREALIGIQIDNLSFSAWQGEGGAHSPFRSRAGDGFAALAQSDNAMRGALHFNGGDIGQFIVSVDTGSGDRRAPLQQVQRDASTYTRLGLDWQMANGAMAFSLGQLDEKMGPLGSYMPIRSDMALPSSTTFTAVGGEYRLSDKLTLSGEIGTGRTELNGRFLNLSKAALSSSWRLGLRSACPIDLIGCRGLVWEFSQPLRIEGGTFEAVLADVPENYLDPVTFSRRSFSSAPSGRQIDMNLRSLHDLPGGSQLNLGATLIREDQHRSDARMGYAFSASWSASF